MNINIVEIITEIFLILLVIVLVLSDKKKMNIIKDSFEYHHVKLYLLVTIVFYLFVNYGINNDSLNLLTIDLQEHNRIREISNQALFGLIIAIFAHLHLFITPFWFIFIFMYFNILTPIH